jgi:hypothetical protein
MKRFLGIAAFLIGSVSPVFATDYVYDIISSSRGPYLSSGDIVTSCDQCVLSSANVVGWSLNINYQAIGLLPGGSPFTSSSLPQSSVMVQGTGFTATSTGLFFNFHYPNSVADTVLFTSGNNSVQLVNSPQSPGSPPEGGLLDCSPSGCAGILNNSNLELGNFAKMEAPELGASGLASTLALLLSGLAILGGRSRRSGSARWRSYGT